MTRGPFYDVPTARKTPDRGLECPACGRILYDADDKSTGWASRAYHAHYVNTHNPSDLNR